MLSKKTKLIIIAICFIIGIYFVGKFAYSKMLAKDKHTENKSNKSQSEETKEVNSGDGINSSKELINFLDGTMWLGQENGYETAYTFSGIMEERGVATLMHGTFEENQWLIFMYDYVSTDKDKLLISPNNNDEPSSCVISPDRKEMTLDGTKFKRVDKIHDWEAAFGFGGQQ